MSPARFASRAASLMNDGPTVPYCGPIVMPTRFGVALGRLFALTDGLDVRRRVRLDACRSVSRSPLRPFWIPAVRRLARIVCSNVGVAARGILDRVGVRRAGVVDRAAGERQRAVRRQALDRERPGDANLLLVLVGLVVEQLELGVPADRRVDLLPAHALLDVGVVGDRLERDVLDSLVDEPVADVVRDLGRRQRRARQLALLPRPSAESASR